MNLNIFYFRNTNSDADLDVVRAIVCNNEAATGCDDAWQPTFASIITYHGIAIADSSLQGLNLHAHKVFIIFFILLFNEFKFASKLSNDSSWLSIV